MNTRIKLKFIGSCLKQEDAAPFSLNDIVNLFIVCELERWSQDTNTDLIPKDCFFGVVKLTKNADPDKYKYSSYGQDLILIHNFYLQMEAIEKMLFLELI